MAGEEALLAGTGGGQQYLAGITNGMMDSASNAFFQYLLNQDAYYKNVQMWNATNRYNSPLEQMKRLEEAGLNPNLVYGNGTVGNTSGNGPDFQAPKVNSVGEGIARMAQIRNLDATTKNLLEQNSLIRAEARLKRVDAETNERDLNIRKKIQEQTGIPLTRTENPTSMTIDAINKLVQATFGFGMIGKLFSGKLAKDAGTAGAGIANSIRPYKNNY